MAMSIAMNGRVGLGRAAAATAVPGLLPSAAEEAAEDGAASVRLALFAGVGCIERSPTVSPRVTSGVAVR